MDVVRIFNNLQNWVRKLTNEQEVLINKLMESKNTNGFLGIHIDDVRSLQEHLLRLNRDVECMEEMKHATSILKPVISDVGFI